VKQKSITSLKTKLWKLTTQIVRKLYGNTCYTCGAKDLEGSNWHTAHFIPSSVCGAGLRYDYKFNLRPSCYRCNIHLSGNWTAFREHLIKDLGEEAVERIIQRKNETTKADRYWYTQKIEEYQKVLQEL